LASEQVLSPETSISRPGGRCVTDLRIGAGTPPLESLKDALIVTVVGLPATLGANDRPILAVVLALAAVALASASELKASSVIVWRVTAERKSIPSWAEPV
jgi:hypothetical protein